MFSFWVSVEFADSEVDKVEEVLFIVFSDEDILWLDVSVQD